MFSRSDSRFPRVAIALALVSGTLGWAADARADGRTEWLERLAREMRETAGVRTPFPCDDGWLANASGYVVDVTAWAEGAGLQRGDHFLAVGGVAVADAGDWGEALARSNAGESLEVRVERAGRQMTLTLPCRDARRRSVTQRQVLDAILAGKWDECIGAARRLSALTDHPFSLSLFLQWNCANEKLKAEQAEGDAPAEFWELYYQMHSRRLEDAKYFPDGIKGRGPEILKAISVLEKHDYRQYAASLRKQLYLAIPEPAR